jgi:hypothetical protein
MPCSGASRRWQRRTLEESKRWLEQQVWTLLVLDDR